MKQIKLDDEQKNAVYSDNELSILISAPPGSGKTLVMAKRIEHLINCGAIKNPFKILGLTFSNTAADEMKERVAKEVPLANNLVHITNFHSFAYSILKAYGNCIDIKRDFFVIGETKTDELTKKALKISKFFELGKYHPKRKTAEDCFYKYKTWKTEHILKMNNDYEDPKYNKKFENCLSVFRDELKSQNALDYDHILYYTFKLLKNNSSVLNYYRAVFKYILVDEFQDTNPLQFAILELMVKGSKSGKDYADSPVFILADPNQGIFEFQGANPENINLAKTEFFCNKINLVNSHRFEKNGESIKILSDAISNFIEENEDETPKTSQCTPYYFFTDKKEEATFIINKINEFEKTDLKLHEIAVLAPRRYNLEILAKKLDKNKFIFVPDFKGSEIEKKYSLLFDELQNSISEDETNLKDRLNQICDDNEINKDDEIIKILIKEAVKYDSKKFSSITFFEKVQLFNNGILLEMNWGKILKKEVKNKVFLSTIHGAKGLEFKTVFLCGLEKDSLPNFTICKSCNRTSEGIKNKESLKMLNVGVSRSKEFLYLCSYIGDNDWGYKLHETCLLDPFLKYLNIA